VQFFPEDGNLIEGITSKVAVKALRGTGHAFVAGGFIWIIKKK